MCRVFRLDTHAVWVFTVSFFWAPTKVAALVPGQIDVCRRARHRRAWHGRRVRGRPGEQPPRPLGGCQKLRLAIIFNKQSRNRAHNFVTTAGAVGAGVGGRRPGRAHHRAVLCRHAAPVGRGAMPARPLAGRRSHRHTAPASTIASAELDKPVALRHTRGRFEWPRHGAGCRARRSRARRGMGGGAGVVEILPVVVDGGGGCGGGWLKTELRASLG